MAIELWLKAVRDRERSANLLTAITPSPSTGPTDTVPFNNQSSWVSEGFQRLEERATNAELWRNIPPLPPPEPASGQHLSRKTVPGLPQLNILPQLYDHPQLYNLKRLHPDRRESLAPSEDTSFETNSATDVGTVRRRHLSAKLPLDETTESALTISNRADNTFETSTSISHNTSILDFWREQLVHEWIFLVGLFRRAFQESLFYDTVTDPNPEPLESMLHANATLCASAFPRLLNSKVTNRARDEELLKEQLHCCGETLNNLQGSIQISRREPMCTPNTWAPETRLLRLKQGLTGLANGKKIAGMADTGSRANIISASYARHRGLKVEGLPSSFEIGNSKKIQSLGTVSLLWAFAENAKETFSITCHVLPRCTYNLILGNGFLSATETMSKFRHRLTKCLFSVINNVSHFGFLGDTYQRLHGTIADTHQVSAIPDTGADRNVMSLQYAIDHGLEIKTGPEHRGYLQFADGSFDETVGQVETSWTFASGERIPVTFEVLEYCCSDVIIGEDILTDHNVFQEHAASIFSQASDEDYYELAPFDYVNSWQRGYEKLKEKLASKEDSPRRRPPAMDTEAEEQRRREVWNHKYNFGTSATTGEKELEIMRRERYKAGRDPGALARDDQNGSSGGETRERWARRRWMPLIPSIPRSRSGQQSLATTHPSVLSRNESGDDNFD